MFNKIFGSKNYSFSDLLDALLDREFDQVKLEKIYTSGIKLNWTNEKSETFLHICAKENRPVSMQWLIKNGAEVDSKTVSGETPLSYAVEYGSMESAELLISKSADLYLLNNENRTLLQEAVKNNHYKMVEFLLKYPIDVNNIDNDGYTLLFDAIKTLNNEMITLILNIGKLNLNHKDSNGNTILFHDSVNVDSHIVSLLIEKGIDVTLKNGHGIDYIFYALQARLLTKNILQKVLTLGYDINTKCNDNTLLLELLNLKNPDIDIIEFLLSKNIDISQSDCSGENVLFKTVQHNDMGNTKILLEKKLININHKNSQGNTVLVYAALYGKSHLNILLELLKNGANPNIADNDKVTLIEKLINTILYTAGKKKISPELIRLINKEDDYLSIFKKILENSKVFLRKLNSHGKPLFFDAIFHNDNILFRILKNHGADINHKDSEGRNILHNLLTMTNSPVFKEQKGFHKLLHELIFQGADVNSKDETGSTTAHNAILLTNEHTLKVLLDSKANMKAVDKQGRSLVHNCVWDSKMKHFKLLQNYNETILNMPDKYGILPINYAAFIGHTELVLEMITARAHVNNPHKKSEKMVSFFRKFYQNVYNLNSNVRDDFERKNIKILISNMKKEFGLQEVQAI